MIVGVLALQGDVPEHRNELRRLLDPEEIELVRTPGALAQVDGLVLPGGESTTMARLLADAGLWQPLAERLTAGLPVLATCAGLILLARELAPGTGGAEPPTFRALDIRIRRNDYGRQRESFEAPVEFIGVPGGPFPGVFIRSPRILHVGEKAVPIAFSGPEIVGVRQGSILGLTFHPELSEDDRILREFVRLVSASQTKRTRVTARRVKTRPTATRVQ